ncbi:MAG: cation:proton antiporter [Ruminococcus sp.]|nr:cation:proton antiporter [Ruminococcus sp.]
MDYLFFIAIILMSTKVLGLMTKKINLPQVVGALLAGLILGPGLGLVEETEFIKNLSEIGVIVLMFSAGLETDVAELKKCGKASFIIALVGVIFPLLGGLGVMMLFNKDAGDIGSSAFLQNVFIGIILTATSVSITVETLKELGKLSTSAGNAIIGAALIDDILGIIALTIVTSLADSSVNILHVLLRILGFFVFAVLFGVLFHILFVKWTDRTTEKLHRYNVMSFAFCLLFAYIADEFFGVADITGAFLAGVLISTSTKIKYISSRFETLSYMLLSPVFFASIGLNVSLPEGGMNLTIILMTLALLVVAILSKIVGCGVGAKLCKYTTKESLQIGIGMVSRGEVALIVANKGASVGLMKSEYFGPIVIMVVITTIITPILLKMAFADKKQKSPAKS